jgi:undecaprenyl-diphosphatase
MVEGFCFLYTALILFLADKCVKGRKEKENIKLGNALTVGIFQGVALMPGISRSGSTISGGLFSGFSRQLAVSYSFILGIPAILGGCLMEVKDASDSGQLKLTKSDMLPYICGFVVAAIVGVLAIKMVSWLVKTNKFKIFSIYTALLGLAVIGISLFEKSKW